MYLWKMLLIGAAAGTVNGIFGAGGGMVLIPLLTVFAVLEEKALFPASVCIMLPICCLSLLIYCNQSPLPFQAALPYLIGSIAGGILAGIFGRNIPTLWLHRALGAMILWGGIRYLC